MVIAVISILASLLLPALSQAKSAARAVQCGQRLRQIGLGLSFYVNDTGAYPLLIYPYGEPRLTWSDVLREYTSSQWTDPLLRCPDYKWRTTTDPELRASGFPELRWGSYAYNGFGSDGSHGLGPWLDQLAPDLISRTLVRESAVAVPSDMIAVGDATLFLWTDYVVSGHIELNWQFGRIMAYNREPAQMLAAYRQRHREKFNVAFCDGHIELLKRRKLFSETDASLRRWNRDHEPHAVQYMREVWRGEGNSEDFGPTH